MWGRRIVRSFVSTSMITVIFFQLGFEFLITDLTLSMEKKIKGLSLKKWIFKRTWSKHYATKQNKESLLKPSLKGYCFATNRLDCFLKSVWWQIWFGLLFICSVSQIGGEAIPLSLSNTFCKPAHTVSHNSLTLLKIIMALHSSFWAGHPFKVSYPYVTGNYANKCLNLYSIFHITHWWQSSMINNSILLVYCFLAYLRFIILLDMKSLFIRLFNYLLLCWYFSVCFHTLNTV